MVNRSPILLAVALPMIACGSEPPVPEARALSLVSSTDSRPGCTDPAEFGVYPDDGLDDRPGLQSYLDSRPAGECVALCLRPGRYQLSRTGGTSHRRTSGVSIERSCVDIGGAGMATELSCEGDGGGLEADFTCITIKGAPGPDPAALVATKGVIVHDLRITGKRIWNSGEQTHLVEVGLPSLGNGLGVSDVQLHDLWFYFPIRQLDVNGDGVPDQVPVDRDKDGQQDTDPTTGEPRWRTTERGGDCIRALGGAGKEVERLTVRDNVFEDCDRSSLAIQRFTSDLLVQGNQFVQVGDAHVDQELTGANGGTARHVYTGNIFRGGRQGEIHFSISGNDAAAAASELIVADNIFDGRGIWILNARRVVIANNQIAARMQSAQGVIHGVKTQDRLVLAGNTLRRMAGSAPGPVVSLKYLGTGLPGDVVVNDNLVEQETAGHVFDFDSAVGVSANDNTILYSGASGGDRAAFFFRGQQRAPDGIIVQGNRSSGPLGAMVRFLSAAGQVGHVAVSGNSAKGASRGIWCGPGTYRRIVQYGNLFEGCIEALTECPADRVVEHWP
jgi:hypothetical protein